MSDKDFKNADTWQDRKRIILAMISAGFSQKQAGEITGVYSSTVKYHTDKVFGPDKFELTESEYDNIVAQVGQPAGKQSAVKKVTKAVLESDTVKFHVVAMAALGFSPRQISKTIGLDAALIEEYLVKQDMRFTMGNIICGEELLDLIDQVGKPEFRKVKR